ncbi:hypothetical protein HDU97_008662 [Phlyctochytrium planicorne]|nr:hypothetical protein HDU97_008662 [Phlyctochytrium planicorne]
MDVAKLLQEAFLITDETYSQYIEQLLEDEDMGYEEKFDIIKEFLTEATTTDVTDFVTNLLQKADEKKKLEQEKQQAEKASIPNSLDIGIRQQETLRELTISEKAPAKQLSKEERRRRDQFLSKYAYDVDEIVEGADGEAEVLYKGSSSTPTDLKIAANDNASRVREAEQQRRAKMKSEHETIQQRNKAALEKQLLDKEKEKRRTQKKEKRRM